MYNIIFIYVGDGWAFSTNETFVIGFVVSYVFGLGLREKFMIYSGNYIRQIIDYVREGYTYEAFELGSLIFHM